MRVRLDRLYRQYDMEKNGQNYFFSFLTENNKKSRNPIKGPVLKLCKASF